MKYLILTVVALTSSHAVMVKGFVPSRELQSISRIGREKTALSVLPKEEEKILRQELTERTSKLENEEKYAVRDGPLVELEEDESVVEEEAAPAPETETEPERLQRRMTRLLKRRAYPLFLAEKAVELIESLIPKQPMIPTKRERIVILGTGWGAISFLKAIDTSLYDVTVISPRNYFLFTPMLAGASVGTVD